MSILSNEKLPLFARTALINYAYELKQMNAQHGVTINIEFKDVTVTPHGKITTTVVTTGNNKMNKEVIYKESFTKILSGYR